jgi:PleD family two-component response regulator
LPDFDGFTLLKQAKFATKHPHTKVVILSNSESASDFAKANALGAKDYLIKVDYSPYGLARMIAEGEI